MRILVTGGAGFLGSHLCDRLVGRGEDVVCVDDFSTGHRSNVAHLLTSPRFSLREGDVRYRIDLRGSFDAVAHLASPASPAAYLRRPIFTLETGSLGTRNVLDFAASKQARFVLASTSEVYGDPLVHPQTEEYCGNVCTVGPRSVYDEAKRYAEAITTAYRTARGVDTGIVRIFNTYGPRMHPDDGRVVSSFVDCALRGEPLTIFGDGRQTRSLCYVDDLVDGLAAMLDSLDAGPINLGNPQELTVLEIAEQVLAATESASPLSWGPLPPDDPTRRRPDVTRAWTRLGWRPTVSVDEGIARTVAWHRARLGAAS